MSDDDFDLLGGSSEPLLTLAQIKTLLNRPAEKWELDYIRFSNSLTVDVWDELSNTEKARAESLMEREFTPDETVEAARAWRQAEDVRLREEAAQREAERQRQEAEEAARQEQERRAYVAARARRELGLPVEASDEDVERAERERSERVEERLQREREAQQERQRVDALVESALAWSPDTMAPTLFRRSDGAGLVYPGRVHSIAGESESGKSWIALHIAREFIEDNAVDFPPEVVHRIGFTGPTVAYLDYDDDPESIMSRVRALGIDEKRFRYEESPDIEDIGYNDTPVRLIVIDNVTAAMISMDLRGSSNEDAAAWFHELHSLFAPGTTVILLDHLTKANDGTGRYALGGVQKLNKLDGAQYIVEVKKPLQPGAIGEVELRVTKDRNGEVRKVGTDYRAYDRSHRAAQFILDSEVPEEIETRVEAPEPRTHVSQHAREALDERLLTYIREHPGATVRELRANVNDDQATLRAALERLTSAGLIRVEAGARGSKRHYAV